MNNLATHFLNIEIITCISRLVLHMIV